MMRPPILLLALLAACQTVGPDYEVPEVEFPDQHHADLAAWQAIGEGPEIDLNQWWAGFQDPVLDELIQRGLRQNHDLRSALGRMHEWQARYGVSDAAAGPRAELNAQYQRLGISENSDFGLFPGQSRETDEFTLGLGASWEIDLWGRLARSIEAAEAEWAGSIEGFWAVQVSLTGQLAHSYLQLRELQNRLGIAQENIAVLERSVRTARARLEAGLVQELDWLRAQTDLESARATLPELERAAGETRSQIALLVGEHPGVLDDLLAPQSPAAEGSEDLGTDDSVDSIGASDAATRTAIPSPKGRWSAPIPADLLRRRPDIRQAERALAAQTARVGVATAELYPSLNLTGSLGYLAADLHNLLEEPSMTHTLTPALRLPLFSGGGLRQNIAVQEAGVEQALVAYEAAILRALHEVDQAALGIRFELERLASLDRAVTQATTSLERSRTLYREGVADIDAVLDARRALFSLQDQAARAQAAHSQAYISLFRSLGGGWPVN